MKRVCAIRFALAATTAAVLVAIISTAMVPKSGSVSAAPPAPPPPGKALFTDKCSACHDLPNPGELLYTRREWQETVNEMLYQHGALYNAQTNSGITTDRAAQIVDYLAQFAPKYPAPGHEAPGATVPEDVWSVEPQQSRSFPFTSEDSLADFETGSGVWKIVPSAQIGEGYLKARPSAGESNSTFVEKKDAVTGDLDISVKLKIFQASSTPWVGLVLDYTDARDCLAVRYDPSDQSLELVRTGSSGDQVLDAKALTGTASAGPEGWHELRVIVHGNGQTVEAWLDYQKRLVGADSGWKSGGFTGLAADSGTVAAFRDMTIDLYPVVSPPSLDD